MQNRFKILVLYLSWFIHRLLRLPLIVKNSEDLRQGDVYSIEEGSKSNILWYPINFVTFTLKMDTHRRIAIVIVAATSLEYV